MKPSAKQIATIRRQGYDVSVDEIGDIINLWTPLEINSYIKTVGLQYATFDKDISGSSASDATKQAWQMTYDTFAAFVKEYDESGWFTRNGMGSVRATERFAEILKSFVKRFETETGKTVSIQEQSKPTDNAPEWVTSIAGSIKYLVIGGLVVGGLYYGSKFFPNHKEYT